MTDEKPAFEASLLALLDIVAAAAVIGSPAAYMPRVLEAIEPASSHMSASSSAAVLEHLNTIYTHNGGWKDRLVVELRRKEGMAA